MASRMTTLAASMVFASTALFHGSALAQAPDRWEFNGSIYAWLPTISGNTAFPPSNGGSGVSVNADTILDNLEFAFMGSLEARKGRWGVFTDLVYLDLASSKSGSRSISLGGTGLPAGVDATVDYGLKGFAWALGGSYRAVSTPDLKFDLIAGARLLDIEQSLDWTLGGNIGPVALADRAGSREAGLHNWDAIVGIKGRFAFGQSRKWFVPYYLDIGTGDSDLTTQAMAGVGYSFGWGDVVASWRYLDYDMKSGKAIQDLNFSGPAIAAVFHW